MTTATLVRAELAKLRTLRSTWVIGAAWILATAGIAALVLATSGDLRETPTAIAAYVIGYTGLAAGFIGALNVAWEYQFRTIAGVFTQVPPRRRVMVAKAVAAAVLGLIVAALGLAVVDGMAAVWLHLSGVAWPWSAAATARAVAGCLAVGATLAVAGVGIGGMVRAPGGATSLVVFVYVGLDNLLSTLSGAWRDYGIGAARTAATDPVGHHADDLGAAVAANVGFAALLLLVGTWIVRRSDV